MAMISAAAGCTRLTMHPHRVDVSQQGRIFSSILQLLGSIYVSSRVECLEGDADLLR